MKFYTIPYYDLLMPEQINEIRASLSCNVFETVNPITKEDQYAIHFQFDEDINIIYERFTEGYEGVLAINKTDFNTQYFET